VYLVGCAFIGAAVAGLHIWLHDIKHCSFAIAIVLDCVGGLAGLFPWQFYIWKTDTLNEK
jgi:hypothetical protein